MDLKQIGMMPEWMQRDIAVAMLRQHRLDKYKLQTEDEFIESMKVETGLGAAVFKWAKEYIETAGTNLLNKNNDHTKNSTRRGITTKHRKKSKTA